MISPETAPLPSFLAVYSSAAKNVPCPSEPHLPGQYLAKYSRVVELVAEREVVGPELDEPVVLPEVVGEHRRHLDADEAADLFADRLDVRRGEVEPVRAGRLGLVLALVARVEVDERRARFGPCRLRDLDDVLDLLARHLDLADVEARGAELAVTIVAGVPEPARLGDVHPEIGPLEHADRRHRRAARRLPAVPRRLTGQPHRVRRVVPAVDDGVGPVLLAQEERRVDREALFDRDVAPDVLEIAGYHQLETRAESRADAVEPAGVPIEGTGGVDADAAAEQLDLQLARIEPSHDAPPTCILAPQRPAGRCFTTAAPRARIRVPAGGAVAQLGER